MSYQRHERGIHVVSPEARRGGGRGSAVTGMSREHGNTRSLSRSALRPMINSMTLCSTDTEAASTPSEHGVEESGAARVTEVWDVPNGLQAAGMRGKPSP